MVNWQFSFVKNEKILCKMSSQHVTLRNSSISVVLVFLHISRHCSDERALDAGRSVTQDRVSHALLLEIHEQPSKKANKPQTNKRTVQFL